MSGHSKWKTNKGKKAAADAVKGATYTKIIKEITVAAREAGGNPDTNFKLRKIMDRAKEANMPSDNVKMAIKRGTGELPGVIYESVRYEGFGPGGVAVMIDAITDNKNRTAAEVRNIMSKKNGNLGGSVSWMFTMKGYISVARSAAKEEELMNIVLDAGAEDIKTTESDYEIYSAPQDLDKVKQALAAKGIKMEAAEVTMVPSSSIKLNESDAKQVLALIEALEEHDDVQDVYDNSEIPDDILEKIQAESEEE
ncbi:MAG: YebC/PmpR family DNA-binding transcriptional regulator [Candidatus Omnitrophica bacterium]|jgi:YebC/PmpR family DNA-binding regulatory protein|nr:YebC/PmpR family DNA-binding transcriptional regulator [Candidatus Omnitrophota bacterium]MDD5079159.1 YebC/PmpR family DNA-binding transcriptional regulator [Candidatus Omnitrophota bacterium]